MTAIEEAINTEDFINLTVETANNFYITGYKNSDGERIQLGSVSAAQRILNGEILQEAVNYGASTGKNIIPFRTRCEFFLDGGLIIPSGSVNWIGKKGSTLLVNYADDCPVLVLGDNTSGSGNRSFKGVRCWYGADQTGNTGAVAIRVGTGWSEYLEDVETIFSPHKPWIGALFDGIPSTPGQEFFFQISLRGWRLGQCQHTSLQINNPGTPNIYSNFYLTGGGHPNVAELSGPLLDKDVFGGRVDGDTMELLNLEWAKTNILARFDGVNKTVLENVHCEGDYMSGGSPCLFYFENGGATITGLNLTEIGILDADVSGTPSIFTDAINGDLSIDSLTVVYANDLGDIVDTPFVMFRKNNFVKAAAPSRNTIRNYEVVDFAPEKGWTNNFAGFTEGVAWPTNVNISKIAHVETMGDNYVYCERGLYTTTSSVTLPAYIVNKSQINIGGDVTITLPDDAEEGYWIDLYHSSSPSTITVQQDGTTITTLTAVSTTTRFTFRSGTWSN